MPQVPQLVELGFKPKPTWSKAMSFLLHCVVSSMKGTRIGLRGGQSNGAANPMSSDAWRTSFNWGFSKWKRRFWGPQALEEALFSTGAVKSSGGG